MIEKKDKNVNLRLSRRQDMIVRQLARKNGISKGEFLRQRIFGSGLVDPATEPSYEEAEAEKDRQTIIDQLDFINKNIVQLMPKASMQRRESILSQLATLRSALDL